MKYAFEIASGSMTYIPSFMTFGSSIHFVLSLLPQQFERLQLLMAGIYEVCH
jgi:hypothetical protein